MKRTTAIVASLLIGTCLVSCVPGTVSGPPNAGNGRLGAPVTGRATVVGQIISSAGFGIKDAPGQNRVDHFVVTLKQGATTVSGPTSVAVANPANFTFNNIATGTNYTIVVDAVDAGNASVAAAAATSAGFDITAAGAIVDTGTTNAAASPIALTLNYAPGALDPGPTVHVTGGGATDKAGISLVNLATYGIATVAAKIVNGPTDFTITNVAQGATTGTNSHQLFYYFANAGNVATVAKSQLVPYLAGSTTGKIDPTQINLPAFSVTQIATNPATNNTGPDIMHTGGFGHTYFYNAGAGVFVREDAVLVDVKNGGPAPTVDCFTVTPVSGKDRFYYYDSGATKIRMIDAQGAPIPADVVDMTASGQAPTCMAADALGAIYWLDGNTGDVYKFPANANPATAATATKVIDHAAVAVGGAVQDIAVDAFGHIYYGVNGKIYKAALGTANGTNYTVPAAPGILATPGTYVQGTLSADAAGNIYFQDGFNPDNLRMVAAGNGATVYTLFGTQGGTASKPSVGFEGTFYYLNANDNSTLKL